jgi:hypothetical protein
MVGRLTSDQRKGSSYTSRGLVDGSTDPAALADTDKLLEGRVGTSMAPADGTVRLAGGISGSWWECWNDC